MLATHEAKIRRAGADDHAEASRLSALLDELHRQRLPFMLKTPEVDPRPPSYFADLLSRETPVGKCTGPSIGQAGRIPRRNGVVKHCLLTRRLLWVPSTGPAMVLVPGDHHQIITVLHQQIRENNGALGVIPVATHIRRDQLKAIDSKLCNLVLRHACGELHALEEAVEAHLPRRS